MLSDQDKKEMLEDDQSPSRREAFRAMKRRHEQTPLSGKDYLDFLEAMHKLFPKQKRRLAISSNDFRL